MSFSLSSPVNGYEVVQVMQALADAVDAFGQAFPWKDISCQLCVLDDTPSRAILLVDKFHGCSICVQQDIPLRGIGI